MAHSLRASQPNTAAEASRHVEPAEEAEDASWSVESENVKLFLPSQLPLSLWSTGCMPGLHEIELKLRIAQISDAFEQMKHHLCIYSSAIHYKITQVSGPGQKANTRARVLLTRLRERVKRCAERYRVSRAALEILSPTGDWQERFRPLLASDIKGPNGCSMDDPVAAMSKRPKRLRGTGEGLRQISWIWRVRRRVPHANAEETSSAEAATENDLDKCKSCFRAVLL